MIPALAVEVGCPDCAGVLMPLASGKPSTTLVSMMLQCTVCRADVQVSVVMAVTHRPKYRPVYDTGATRSRKSRSKAKVPA